MTIIAVAVALSAAPLAAQGRGKGGGSSKPPAPTKPAHPAPHAPATPPAGGHDHGSKPATPPSTHAGVGDASHGKKSAPATAAKATPPATDAAEHLRQQPQLQTKLAGLLPPGTNLQAAAAGFRNLGQFVAAVHVSHNLGIPFDQLRLRMTGPDPMSLGQAIQSFKPSTNVSREVKRAEDEAREDMRIRR
jgi:hypothetical protein